MVLKLSLIEAYIAILALSIVLIMIQVELEKSLRKVVELLTLFLMVSDSLQLDLEI